MISEFSTIGFPNPNEEQGGHVGVPAVCAWLDAESNDKWALLEKLKTYGPLGRVAAVLLTVKDPRMVTYLPKELRYAFEVTAHLREEFREERLSALSEPALYPPPRRESP
jgi:hypothetical protein